MSHRYAIARGVPKVIRPTFQPLLHTSLPSAVLVAKQMLREFKKVHIGLHETNILLACLDDDAGVTFHDDLVSDRIEEVTLQLKVAASKTKDPLMLTALKESGEQVITILRGEMIMIRALLKS